MDGGTERREMCLGPSRVMICLLACCNLNDRSAFDHTGTAAQTLDGEKERFWLRRWDCWEVGLEFGKVHDLRIFHLFVPSSIEPRVRIPYEIDLSYKNFQWDSPNPTPSFTRSSEFHPYLTYRTLLCLGLLASPRFTKKAERERSTSLGAL